MDNTHETLENEISLDEAKKEFTQLYNSMAYENELRKMLYSAFIRGVMVGIKQAMMVAERELMRK